MSIVRRYRYIVDWMIFINGIISANNDAVNVFVREPISKIVSSLTFVVFALEMFP